MNRCLVHALDQYGFGGIASLTVKAMTLIEEINEERDDRKSSRSGANVLKS